MTWQPQQCRVREIDGGRRKEIEGQRALVRDWQAIHVLQGWVVESSEIMPYGRLRITLRCPERAAA